jgi:uncharacterized membrane protein SirB2
VLVAYIVSGSLALRRAREPGQRAVAYFVALACYALVYSIARTHHPLGLLQGLG